MRSFSMLCALMLASSAVAQDAPRVAPPEMREAAPALARYTDQVLFGDVWARPGLSPRDRSLVTVAALVAGDRSAQLPSHLGRALDNGMTPVELSGIITHVAFYAGWPPAVSAVTAIHEFFTEQGITVEDLSSDDAALLPVPPSDAERAATVDRNIGPTAPGLAELTNEALFGDLWRRLDLAPRDRSLATIASLITTGDAEQLAFHIPLGMENGLTEAEIAEAITHLAFYAGWPKAMSAVPMLAEATDGNSQE